ncbi:MAG: NUDIX domain-containing protein [Bacteroidetes bacterium]|nr:NUDIX domain-containing protein [Bacteroidota bacterium]
MKFDIYCDENLITLLDTRPVNKRDNETQVRFSGKKSLNEIVPGFEKSSKKCLLSIWSDGNFNQLVKVFFNLHETVEAAGGVVFNEHGEILFIHRNGKWDLPKGKISGKDRRKAEKGKFINPSDPGYTDINLQVARLAAIREVKEETGLKNLKLVSELPLTYHIYYNGDRRFIKTTRWFRMEGTTADLLVPQIEEGIIIARWIPANSLACIFMHTYESLKPLIKSVLANT